MLQMHLPHCHQLEASREGQDGDVLLSILLFTRCNHLRHDTEGLIKHALLAKEQRRIYCNKYRKGNYSGHKGETNYLTSTLNWTVRFNVQFEDILHDAASFFRQPKYRVKISTGVSSNAILTVASLLDTDAGPNSINEDFLPAAWNESIKSIKSLQLWTAIHEVMNVEGTVPVFIRMTIYA